MIVVIFLILELTLLSFSSRFLTQALSLLFLRITRSKKLTIYFLSLIFFPGVIIHELSHAFMATALFVPVGEIEFMPQLQEKGVKLGSVAVGKTDPLRRFLIGVAPFLIGIFLILLTGYAVFLGPLAPIEPLWKILIVSYVFFEIGNTMFSSRKDLEGALQLLVVSVVVTIGLWAVGVRVPVGFFEALFAQKAIEATLTQMMFFLMIPLGINIGLVLLINLILKDDRR